MSFGRASSIGYIGIDVNRRHSPAAALHLSQLLVDMNIDVFIQEPFATSSPTLTYVPDDYIELHSFSSNHAYGAAILVKRIHYPTLLPLTVNNYVAGSEITVGNHKLSSASIQTL